MTCGIYMIQNKVNGKIYIGQALDIESRWGKHKNLLRGNKNSPNKHLQYSWNKYGEDNFEFTIICECDENQLNTMEEYYIFELMSYDKRVGYNKNYGGSSGRPTEETRKKMGLKGEKNPMYGRIGKLSPNYGKHWSEETKRKISESHKGKYGGENHPLYGKHHSEETRKKISKANKGKTASEETRKKQSEALKVALNRPEVKKKMSEARTGENNGMYGKHHSEETRRKQSEVRKGKYVGENSPLYGKPKSEEHRKHLSESKKGKCCGEKNPMYGRTGENNPNYGTHRTEETKKKMSENNGRYWKGKFGAENPTSIPIVQLSLSGELVKVYESIAETGRNGFTPSNITTCAKGKAKTHKHYKWMYLHEYIAKMNPNIKTVNLFGKTYEVNQEEVKIG